NTLGNQNTASGVNALFNNTTGANNIASGYHAGFANTTGQGNTFLGYLADAGSATLTNATAIGANAVVGESNALVLARINGVNGATASVNVGIGTATPAQMLDVAGNINASGGATAVSFSGN